MTGWVIRAMVLMATAIASAIGVWKVHAIVGGQLGTVGGVLAALVAALMLGSLLWILAVVLLKRPRRRLPSTGPREKARDRW
jgi:hypothetical protein